jgi:hypothetical protein
METMTAVTVSESRPWNADKNGYDDSPITYRVACSGGTEHAAHGKVYEGPSAELALAAQDSHRDCVPRIDSGIAFLFSTVAGRHQVLARFMTDEDLRRSHGGRYTRTYVDISDVNLGGHPPYSMKGDDPTNDAAWRAFNRKELNAMKLKLSRVRPVLERVFGMAPGAFWSFSRKAGCSCSCSPGFVMKGSQIRALADRGWYGVRPTPVDLWVI